MKFLAKTIYRFFFRLDTLFNNIVVIQEEIGMSPDEVRVLHDGLFTESNYIGNTGGCRVKVSFMDIGEHPMEGWVIRFKKIKSAVVIVSNQLNSVISEEVGWKGILYNIAHCSTLNHAFKKIPNRKAKAKIKIYF